MAGKSIANDFQYTKLKKQEKKNRKQNKQKYC